MHTYTQPKAPKQNKLTPTAQVFNLGGFSLRAFFFIGERSDREI